MRAMKSLNNRISKLEDQTNIKKLPVAWVATQAVDGTVSLSMGKEGKKNFENREALEEFLDEKNRPEFGVLFVSIVNAKGEPPEEL